jgi:hypothetical protein
MELICKETVSAWLKEAFRQLSEGNEEGTKNFSKHNRSQVRFEQGTSQTQSSGTTHSTTMFDEAVSVKMIKIC